MNQQNIGEGGKTSSAPGTGSVVEKTATRTRASTILNDEYNFGIWKWNLKYTLKALGLYRCVTEDYGTQ